MDDARQRCFQQKHWGIHLRFLSARALVPARTLLVEQPFQFVDLFCRDIRIAYKMNQQFRRITAEDLVQKSSAFLTDATGTADEWCVDVTISLRPSRKRSLLYQPGQERAYGAMLPASLRRHEGDHFGRRRRAALPDHLHHLPFGV